MKGRWEGIRIVSVTLALAALILVTIGPQPQAKALSPYFRGMVVSSEYWPFDNNWEGIEHSGSAMTRMQFNWQTVAEKGWANSYDQYVKKAVMHGQQVLPYLYGRKTATNNSRYYLEPEWAEFESVFVQEAVKRYGYNGKFWSENPSVPYRPIWVWEVWNEENAAGNSPNGEASGKTYAKFLKATDEAIQSAQNQSEPNPHTTLVLFGGLYQPDHGISVSQYLEDAKNSGASVSAHFNGLAIHPYGFGKTGTANTESARLGSLQENVNEARSALNSLCAGCSNKTLWVTEFGWGVAGTGNTVRSAKEQSNLLFSAYDWLQGASAALKIEYAAWYLQRDRGGSNWDDSAGLRDVSGAYRSSWFTYQGVTGAPKWPADVPAVWPADNLGGEIAGDPAIDTWGPESLSVWVRATDSSLQQRYFSGGSWSGWELVPGSAGKLAGGPSATSWAPGRHDIVARGTKNQVLHWSWDSSDPKWYFDEALGSPKKEGVPQGIVGDPAISSWGKNRLDLFAQGWNGHLWHRWFNGSGWGEWEQLPGATLVGGPSAVSWGPGRIDVVARGSSDHMLHWSWDESDSIWYFDEALGGGVSADPAISSRGIGKLDVFARDEDYHLMHRSYDVASGGWSAVESLGGEFLTGGASAVSWDGGRVDIVARSNDDSVYHVGKNMPSRYVLGTSNGTGISGRSTVLSGMDKSRGMTIGDVNGDGKADVVSVERESSGNYRYMLGTSNGSGFSWSLTSLTGMSEPVQLAAGDVNGDGKDDLVAVERESSGNYRYMLGTSNGSNFSWNYTNLTGMGMPAQIALGDVNGDGKDDLVATEKSGSYYNYMLGIGNGSNFAWNFTNLTAYWTPYQLALGDINKDGLADIVAVEATNNNPGLGTYEYKVGLRSGSNFSWKATNLTGMWKPYWMRVGDVNKDGYPDIISVEAKNNNPNTGKYEARFGLGAGSTTFSWSTVLTNLVQQQQFGVGDVTGDGKADVVSVEFE
jgi:hypothetical protein